MSELDKLLRDTAARRSRGPATPGRRCTRHVPMTTRSPAYRKRSGAGAPPASFGPQQRRHLVGQFGGHVKDGRMSDHGEPCGRRN